MKISIIIPTYNRANLLRDALDSIVAFVEGEVEVLVCDDGSTDDTASVCGEYAAKGIAVVHNRSAERLGAQEARNRGLAMVTGDVVMFMDSDDALAGPGIMDLVVALEGDPGLGYAYGRVVSTDAALRPFDPPRSTGAAFANVPRELAGYHWHTMGALYRRETVEAVGSWNVDLRGSQDWEYQARVKLFGGRGLFVDSMVGWWRQHDGDRVGTTKFRPDYVNSVMVASDSILRHARDSGHRDVALEHRIAKRLIVHALEWGTNGHPQKRNACFMQAIGGLTSSPVLKRLIKIMIWMPSVLDRLIWMRLVA